MKNEEVAKLLYEIANLLEIKDEKNVFKVRAYRRAAQAIEALPDAIEDYAKSDRLHEIPGVGASIAEKIMEFLETGRLKYYETLRKRVPIDLESLRSVEGMGPKKIKLLHKKLKIANVKDLEREAKAGRIRKIKGLGAKTEENILRAIANASQYNKRALLGVALPVAEEIVAYLKRLPHVRNAIAAGSLRRMKETIGDLDILITTANPKNAIDRFCAMPDVMNVIARGPTKASVHLKSGMQVDLRVLRDEEYGAALMYFTGSKEHNIELRKIAIAKHLKLSEYGLFRGSKMIAGATEEEVYKSLGLDYIAPEMREMCGEIDAAKAHKLPDLIGYRGVKGDLQMHTTWSDGSATVEEMALAAKRLGYEYICVTDHVGELKIARALDESELAKQAKEIDRAAKKTGMRILKGAEIDIRADGRFDVSDSALKRLDVVVASLHSQLHGNATQRILDAMDNEHVDIIGHPSGRKIDSREGAQLNMQEIIRKSLDTGTLLEINADPRRLDLNDVNARAAVDAGCVLAISTDAHMPEELRNMRLGIGIARRAWAQEKNIINALPFAKFAKRLGI